MRQDDVNDDLRELAFEFFFWFSRFESALKERGYLKHKEVGARAEPSWDFFVSENRGPYKPNAAAYALMEAKPQRQIVGDNGTLNFEEVPLSAGIADLDRVVALAKTVRNNLFHGGKTAAHTGTIPTVCATYCQSQ